MPNPIGRNNAAANPTCVRHSNEDIVKLYDALNVGDHVAIVSGLKDARQRH